MTSWCIWCETRTCKPPKGKFWIHEKCFFELDDVRNKIKTVEKYLKGELPRIKENGDMQGYESVEKFLVSMDDFNRRWTNLTKLIEKREHLELLGK